MTDPMIPEDERRIAELLAMHPALLQPEAIELRAEVKRLRAERDEARTAQQRSDELLAGAHNDLCEALGVRRRPLLDVIQHAATVRAERDELQALADAQATAAREAAEDHRDETARLLEHLRIAHPRHFTPNVLGDRLCGCIEQWPCGEHVNLPDAETHLYRVFTDADVEGVDLNAMTVAELTEFVMAAIRRTGQSTQGGEDRG